MADLNPQPLPPRAISLEDAVAAITRGVLRALEARETAEAAPAASAAGQGGTLAVPSHIRIIAGGILEPALSDLQQVT